MISILLILFIVAGLYEMVHGGASTSSDPNRFTAPPTTAAGASGSQAGAPTAPGGLASVASSATGCYLRSAEATSMVAQLIRRDHFPVNVIPASVTGPDASGSAASPCSSVSFTDARGHATNRLVSYLSDRAASKAAIGSDPITVGHVLVYLDASLASQIRQRYTTAITQLLASSGGTATLAAGSPPASAPGTTRTATP